MTSVNINSQSLWHRLNGTTRSFHCFWSRHKKLSTSKNDVIIVLMTSQSVTCSRSVGWFLDERSTKQNSWWTLKGQLHQFSTLKCVKWQLCKTFCGSTGSCMQPASSDVTQWLSCIVGNVGYRFLTARRMWNYKGDFFRLNLFLNCP